MKALALGLALASCQPTTIPSIFLSLEPDGQGFITTAKGRPIGTSMGEISIADINNFLRQNPLASSPICHLAEVNRSSFVGTDRASQQMLEEDFGYQSHDLFRQPISTPDGRNFVAQIGLAEYCDTGTAGAIIVISDLSNGELVFVEMTGWPPMYMWPVVGGASIQVADCIACDSFNWLTYDPESQDFDWAAESGVR